MDSHFSSELRLSLEGLNCANCSARIEEQVSGLPGVSGAAIDLVGGRMKVFLSERGDSDELLSRIRAVVDSIEPGVVVSEESVSRSSPVFPRKDVFRLSSAAVLWILAIFLPGDGAWRTVLYVSAYLVAGINVLRSVFLNFRKGIVFDEFFLMAAATFGAFAIGEFAEAVAVMLFYESGELVQSIAVDRSRRSILSLMDIRPDSATLLENGTERRVKAMDVKMGQTVLIRPGERVPLDGIIFAGTSSLDTSSLTGESVPRDAAEGDEVLAGSVNMGGTLSVEVSRPFGESTLSKGLRLIEEARERKAPTERFITSFAKWYTPVVVILAALLAVIPPLAGLGAFRDWGYRALVFLVVSCPCALVISVPLALFGGIGAASRRGLLLKGGSVLETMARTKAVLFDKTGTLTQGKFRVTGIFPAGRFSREELLAIAGAAERGSNHPIAMAVASEAGAFDGPVEAVKELPGLGVRLLREGEDILAGNARLLERNGVNVDKGAEGKPGAVVHIARNGTYAGHIVVEDTLRHGSSQTVRRLRGLGVSTIGMLSGDRPENAAQAAEILGLDIWEGGLMPSEKLDHFQKIRANAGGVTLFIGDGMNDAPLLAAADVGLAMGGLGADVAIEAADGVILSDDPLGVADGIEIARRTRSIVWQNIAFALGVKGLVLALGAFGMATMWEAVFADVGVAVLATLNAARILKTGTSGH
ncbi:heavy metal translocating P-type ATPase [Aminivibrio sp.]|uniref:heavy metal translocating P-type ATPase n=1 Tax=Aminivibrio sp. TaxID=1872489 RepID=UPI00345EFA07